MFESGDLLTTYVLADVSTSTTRPKAVADGFMRGLAAPGLAHDAEEML